MEKLEWWGYPTAKKIENIYNGLDTILACDRQTDRRTDGHLATTYTPYAYASRSKNDLINTGNTEIFYFIIVKPTPDWKWRLELYV